MKLPLTVNDNAEVHDADGKLVADFWTIDSPPDVAQANAEQYAAMMNARWEAL